MSDFYSSLAEDVYELIEEFGFPVVVKTPVKYKEKTDTSTGVKVYVLSDGTILSVPPAPFSQEGVAVEGAYKQVYRAGITVSVGDIRLYVSGANVATGDTITFKGKTKLVVSSFPIEPGDVTLLSDVQLR